MPVLIGLFFFSGACGLAYQVLWVRQLSFVFGVTAYAAGTVLAAFMAGLALGSWLAGPLLRRIRRPLAAFGLAELLIGASAADVMELTEFDEGPLPADWVGELERRGIAVRRDIARDEARGVLKHYSASGGAFY